MYTMLNDGRPLFDPRLGWLSLRGALLRQEANRLSTLEFTIFPGHPEYSRLSKAESVIAVKRDGALAGLFRPVQARAAFRGGIFCRCEELAARLNDALDRPHRFEGTVAEGVRRAVDRANEAFLTANVPLTELGDRVLQKGMAGRDVRRLQAALTALSYDVGRWGADGIFGAATRAAVCAFQRDEGLSVTGVFDAAALGRLRARLEAAGLNVPAGAARYPSFAPGRIAHEPDGALVYEETGYPGLWDALMARVVSAYGGYLLPRYEDDTIYIDYLGDEDLPEGAQTIRFGRNLGDLTVRNDASGTFTTLIPLGKRLSGGQRLTVASVNGGSDRIDSETGLSLYGRRERTIVWDDEGSAERLLRRGRACLAAFGTRLEETIDISAVDLRNAGGGEEALRWMTRCRVVSPLHGVDGWYTLRRVTTPLGDPSRTEISLGAARLSLTDSVSGRDTPTGEALSALSATGDRLTRPLQAMTGPSEGGCAASASSERAGAYAAWRAFDYSDATAWLSGPGDASPWLQLRLDRPLSRLRVYVYSRAGAPAHNPTAGTVYGSADGEAWEEIGSFSGWSGAARGALLGTVDCAPEGAWRYVRLSVEAHAGEGYAAVGYVIVTGEPAEENEESSDENS